MAARIAPDQASIEIAHRYLGSALPLDVMLAHPAHRLILENVARRHMQRRQQFDAKRLQSNDRD